MIRIVSAALFWLGLSAGPVVAQIACALYEHDNYRGHSLIIGAGQRFSNVGAGWNDKASSVRVGPGCTLTLYQHSNFSGDQRTVTGDTASLGNLWNDQTSSASCQCTRGVDRFCRFYADVNFNGANRGVAENTSLRYVGDAWNDKISSVKVPQGCSLRVYQHRDFGGDSRVFAAGDYAAVGALWNDQASSLQCSCR